MTESEQKFLEGMWQKAEEKEQALLLADSILQEPTEPDFSGFLKNVFFGIGLRRLYADMIDIISIAFAVTLFLFFILLEFVQAHGNTIYAAAFLNAPILYAGIFFLSWAKEQGNGVYSLQMTCKYTFFHVLAARMFGESLLGLLVNGIYAITLMLRYHADGVRLLALSFTSLMLFSSLLILGFTRHSRLRGAILYGGGWFTLNLSGVLFLPDFYGKLLESIPIYVLIGIGAAVLWLYLRRLLFLTELSFRKEYTNAKD